MQSLVLCSHFFSTTGVTLGFVQPAVNIFENQSLVKVCIAISDIPTGGLECDVDATIAFVTGGKTSEFHILNTVVTVLIWKLFVCMQLWT